MNEKYKAYKAKMENISPKCEAERCTKIQISINRICIERKWKAGSPFVLDRPDGSVCYCSCGFGSFDYSTWVQINANTYRVVNSLRPGNDVMVCGEDIVWKTGKVDFYNVIDPNADMVRIMVRFEGTPPPVRDPLVVSSDQLLLVMDSGNKKKLVAAGMLKPSDILVSYQGLRANIERLTLNYPGYFSYQLGTAGPIKSLEGHLLNTSGLVAADFTIQTAYISGQLDESWLVDDFDERIAGDF